MSKPKATVEDVPEEEFKISPRQLIPEHSTPPPQIKVAPLVSESKDDSFCPGSLPARPTPISREEEK